MNELQIFANPQFGSVRSLIINDDPWFVGKDVADALGYVNSRDTLVKRVDDEDKGVANCDTPSGKQQMTIINESGLYSLIFSSKLESAKKFKRWVTSEVLPALRKTGSYNIKSNLTKEDYFRVAEFIVKCPADRTTLLENVLVKMGFEKPKRKKAVKQDRYNEPGLVELLNQFSIPTLTKVLNLSKSTIHTYRTGYCKPSIERGNYIVTTLTKYKKGCGYNGKISLTDMVQLPSYQGTEESHFG